MLRFSHLFINASHLLVLHNKKLDVVKNRSGRPDCQHLFLVSKSGFFLVVDTDSET